MNKEEILKYAKPFLFNTGMVKAILDDRKTATRRTIKFKEGMTGHLPENGAKDYLFYPGGIKYPPCRPGNFLYVRETWDYYPGRGFLYKADHDDWVTGTIVNNHIIRWHPSIHMPKEGARLFLIVSEVRAERLQDMTEDDAIKEGFVEDSIENDDTNINFMCSVDCLQGTAKGKFAFLWNKTIKKQDVKMYGWDADPWVWTIEFERVGA